MAEKRGLTLTLRVDISADSPTGFPNCGSLHIEQTFRLRPMDFIEITRVLGTFQELANTVAGESQ